MREDHKILHQANSREVKHKDLDSSPPRPRGENPVRKTALGWNCSSDVAYSVTLGVSLSLSEPPLMGEAG